MVARQEIVGNGFRLLDEANHSLGGAASLVGVSGAKICRSEDAKGQDSVGARDAILQIVIVGQQALEQSKSLGVFAHRQGQRQPPGQPPKLHLHDPAAATGGVKLVVAFLCRNELPVAVEHDRRQELGLLPAPAVADTLGQGERRMKADFGVLPVTGAQMIETSDFMGIGK